MHQIRMRHTFAAPPDRVFALITDHAGMSRWLGGAKITLEQPGSPSPNGLGAVRRISARGLSIYEQVIGWEEPRAMDYRVLRGAPIRDHLGQVRLEPSPEGGTVVDYRIRFRVPWYFGGVLLGSLIAGQLKGEIEKGLGKLATLL